MEKRNKRWRIKERNKRYAALLKLAAAQHFFAGITTEDGRHLTNPRWIDLYKANWCPVYKSVHTPCSCMYCKTERYNRRLYKKETCRMLADSGL